MFRRCQTCVHLITYNQLLPRGVMVCSNGFLSDVFIDPIVFWSRDSWLTFAGVKRYHDYVRQRKIAGETLNVPVGGWKGHPSKNEGSQITIDTRTGIEYAWTVLRSFFWDTGESPPGCVTEKSWRGLLESSRNTYSGMKIRGYTFVEVRVVS